METNMAITEYSSRYRNLPSVAYFLAGGAQQKTGIGLNQIFSFLDQFYHAIDLASFDTSFKTRLENLVFQGKLGLVSTEFNARIQCIENCSEKNLQLVKLGCGHIFHKKCVLKSIGNEICCPHCKEEVDLETIRHISYDLYLELEQIQFEQMVQSGVLGKLMQCPCCSEVLNVETPDFAHCPSCGTGICAQCSKLLQICKCPGKCPACASEVYNEYGHQRVMCKKCFVAICWKCRKMLRSCLCKN